MPTKNIFAGIGVRTTFVNILYEQLKQPESLREQIKDIIRLQMEQYSINSLQYCEK